MDKPQIIKVNNNHYMISQLDSSIDEPKEQDEHDESQHGVTWETVEFKIVEQEERYKIGTDIDWFYRVRDSY